MSPASGLEAETRQLLRGAGTYLIAALLFGFSAPAFAGVAEPTPTVPPKTVVEKKPEANPLCFADGKLCLDVQERFRFEARDNTFDFNSSVDSLTDDNFFLNRFRLGIAIKPVDWLKLYAQGQDSEEFQSDRPDVPGALGAEGDNNFDLRQASGRN
jgi:hypothetical protein